MKIQSLLFRVAMGVFVFMKQIQGCEAGLGELEQSIENDRLKLSINRQASITQKGAFTIHEISNEQIVIREYVSQGSVFAVSWHGVRHPDLRNLLGRYFQDFSKNASRAFRVKGLRSYGIVRARGVVVERSGHMRGVQGRAYVPVLMPHEMDSSEIR